MCTVASARETYGEVADCCEKQEPERNQCFLKNKDDDPNFPKLVRPSPEVLCTAFQENDKKILDTYLYEISRRHPYFYAPELLYYVKKYKEMLAECCQAADKAACLTPKADDLKSNLLASDAKQRYKCSSLEKFGERPLKAWTLAVLSQRYPKTDFMELSKLVTSIVKVQKECCHGDLLECADDREEVIKYMCEHQDSISNKLKACCDKPLLEKSHCILEMENDEKPDDLPSLTDDYVEDKEVCKNYKEAKDVFLGTFLYEYSRRHPEYSVSMVLRIAKEYEATLERCCATDDPHACYAKVLDELQVIADEPQKLIKKKCDLYESLGEYRFQNALIIRYTKKLPLVSTPSILKFAKEVGNLGGRCCKRPESKRLACAEDYMSMTLNRLCVLHEKTPVSDKITKCCSGSLVNRRPCFSALEADETYVPKEFNAETFTFHADVCTLPDDEKILKKQIALVELLKHKPKATEEQLKTVMENFSAFMQKCCTADDKEACFAEEGPKLVASSQATLA